jgi:hypothetical protein
MNDDDDGQFFSHISLQVDRYMYVCMPTHGVKLLQQSDE